MSIRLIALELYKAQQLVDQLEKELEKAAPGAKDGIREKLRIARAEMMQLRKILDGRKA